MNQNIQLDNNTKNILQIESSYQNQTNNNIIVNSQISQTNILSVRNSTIKSNCNLNNLNLLQSPKNIYKNFNFEENNLSEKILSEENHRKIVRIEILLFYLFHRLKKNYRILLKIMSLLMIISKSKFYRLNLWMMVDIIMVNGH